MRILGINAFHPDAAVALVEDGRVVWAAEEERFDRVKHSWGFPTLALRRCLDDCGLRLAQIDGVAVGKNSRVLLGRKLLHMLSQRPTAGLVRNCLRIARKGAGLEAWIARAADLGEFPATIPIVRVEHHLAHASSAFLVSPFERAAFLSLDGLGDFSSASWGLGEGCGLHELGRVRFPHSAGYLYTAGTQYLGFHEFGDEYKVMGLAAYGRPRHLDLFRRIVSFERDGTFRLGLDFFTHHRSRGAVFLDWRFRLYSPEWARQLGPPRQPREAIEERHADVAASLQARLEELYWHVLGALHRATAEARLCLAGGVAFNSVANGKIGSHTPFTDVFIQPAAGDAGTAVGAALWAHSRIPGARRPQAMDHVYLGVDLDEGTVAALLERSGLRGERLDDSALIARTAGALAEGRIVGWVQGRMEFGPRALGNRSILADPRRAEMQTILNDRIKRRESFRPFAPSVPRDEADDWFELDRQPSPFMLRVVPIRADKLERIPAVRHVDGTARPHTVDPSQNPLFCKLLRAFGERTGVPILLNTSFNENEPIVCTAEHALDCFLRSGIDVLVLGNRLLERPAARKVGA